MRAAVIGALFLTAIVGISTPVSVEASWFSEWKDYLNNEIFNKGKETSSDKAPEAESQLKSEPAANTTQPSYQPVEKTPHARPATAGNYALSGKWRLSKAGKRSEIGTLTANGSFFTIELREPKVDLRLAYRQAKDGGFRSTVLDKNVVTMEGRFDNRNRFNLIVEVKEIGRPGIKTHELVAIRNR